MVLSYFNRTVTEAGCLLKCSDPLTFVHLTVLYILILELIQLHFFCPWEMFLTNKSFETIRCAIQDSGQMHLICYNFPSDLSRT